MIAHIEEYRVRNHRQVSDHDHLAAITKREEEILVMVAYEYTTAMIADKLYISHHTVDTHRKRLMVKLGANNTAGMVRRGFEIGLLTC